MTRFTLRKFQQWIQALSIMTIAITIMGCSSGAKAAVATPTPIPAPNIKGIWEGCIQGSFLHPNEPITLDVTEENTAGTFAAVYGENWNDFLVVDNDRIVGNWDVYDSDINLAKSIRFTVNVMDARTTIDGSAQIPVNYDFRGGLNSAGKLSGKVTEGFTPSEQHDWTLSRSGGCPYP
jgi:hypothetical protein